MLNVINKINSANVVNVRVNSKTSFITPTFGMKCSNPGTLACDKFQKTSDVSFGIRDKGFRPLVFEEAQTMKEAIRFADKSFGIEYCSVSKKSNGFSSKFQQDDLEIANYINEYLTAAYNLTKGNILMPETVIIEDKSSKGTASIASAGEGVSFIGEEKYFEPYMTYYRDSAQRNKASIGHFINSIEKYHYLEKTGNKYSVPPFVSNKDELQYIPDILNKYRGRVDRMPLRDVMTVNYFYQMATGTFASEFYKNLRQDKAFIAKHRDEINQRIRLINQDSKPQDYISRMSNPDTLDMKDASAFLQVVMEMKGSSLYIPRLGPETPIFHELGHLQHRECYKQYSLLKNPSAVDSHQRKPVNSLAQKISENATISPVEFVAEVYARLLQRQKFSSDIMELYRFYRGPQVSI